MGSKSGAGVAEDTPPAKAEATAAEATPAPAEAEAAPAAPAAPPAEAEASFEVRLCKKGYSLLTVCPGQSPCPVAWTIREDGSVFKPNYDTFEDALAACLSDPEAGGITRGSGVHDEEWTVRQGTELIASTSGEESWLKMDLAYDPEILAWIAACNQLAEASEAEAEAKAKAAAAEAESKKKKRFRMWDDEAEIYRWYSEEGGAAHEEE